MRIAQYLFIVLCIISIFSIMLNEFNIKSTVTWYDDFESGGEIGKAKEIAKYEFYRTISFFFALVFGVLAYLTQKIRK